jgi:hypothetical protein
MVVLFPNVAIEGTTNQNEKKVAEAIYQVLEPKEEVKEFPKPSTEEPKEVSWLCHRCHQSIHYPESAII